MKINFVLAAATATIVLVDGGHPYQYEGDWDQRSQNALVSSRQSPNPLNSRQAFAALLTPGVAAAIASVSIPYFHEDIGRHLEENNNMT